MTHPNLTAPSYTLTETSGTRNDRPVTRISVGGYTVGYTCPSALDNDPHVLAWEPGQFDNPMRLGSEPAAAQLLAMKAPTRPRPIPYTDSNPASVVDLLEAHPAQLVDYLDHIDLIDGTPGHQPLVFMAVDSDDYIVEYDLGLSTHCFDPNCCDIDDGRYYLVPGLGWVVRD